MATSQVYDQNGTWINNTSGGNIETSTLDALPTDEAEPLVGGAIGVIGFAFSAALMVAIIFGNTLTLVSYWKYPGSWLNSEAASIFLINVAFADLIVGVLIIPMQTVFGLSYAKNSSVFVCVSSLILGSISLEASSYFLVLATVDKYVAIHWPFKHIKYFTKSKAKLIATVLWPFLVAVGVGMDSWTVWDKFEEVGYCEPALQMSFWCALAFVVLDFGAFPLLIVLNAHIFVIVRRRGTQSGVPEATHSNAARTNSTGSIASTRMSAWKVISTVVATYIICRLPLTLTLVTQLVYFAQGKDVDELKTPLMCTIIISVGNSCMNPIIYYKTMPSIRTAFKKVLCC